MQYQVLKNWPYVATCLWWMGSNMKKCFIDLRLGWSPVDVDDKVPTTSCCLLMYLKHSTTGKSDNPGIDKPFLLL